MVGIVINNDKIIYTMNEEETTTQADGQTVETTEETTEASAE